jgi:DNA-binding transcriptional LysR family regulator
MPLDLGKLPPLDLLRGFVAAGRRMSITLAAADLFLTQSAVSRQIHALEAHLGVRLLVRGHRSIAFTPEGERLFRSADGALQQLQDVLGELRTTGRFRPVTISAATGFVALWLLPRLGRLQKSHPALDVRISANNQLVDLRNEGIDLAIRYTNARQAPPGASRLFGEMLAPVAAPSLGLKPIRAAGNLAKLTLLEFDDPRAPWLHWSSWLESMGWGGASAAHHLRFNQYDMVIQAAMAGQGVALGRLDLIRHLVDEGRLVWLAPPRQATSTSHAYWLVSAEDTPRTDVSVVADWIRAEANSAAGLR